MPKPFVVGVDLGHLAPPPGQALGRGGPVDRLAAQLAGVDGLALDDRMDLDARRPFAVGGDDGLEAHQVVGHERRGGRELDAPCPG